MNESVSKNRGQKHLFSAFFEFLKLQYETNFAFIALKEGPPEKEYLRIVATFGEDTGRLTNFKLVKEENDNDELLWDCLATGTARVVEDGSVLSPVENEMCVPFLLAAPAKPPEGREDEEQLKPDVVAVVGVALPNLAIAEGEGEGESEPAKSSAPPTSANGDELDEEELRRLEMIEPINAAAAQLGLSLMHTWRQLDEPRIHRLQLAMSKIMDDCVSNALLAAQGTKKLARIICKHMKAELSHSSSEATVLVGVMDDTHEQLWLSGESGPPLLNGTGSTAELPAHFHRDSNADDLVWKAITALEVMHVPKCDQETVFGTRVSQHNGEPYSVLVVPLIVVSEEDAEEELEMEGGSKRGFCVGVLVFVRKATAVPDSYDASMDADIEQGFTSDEKAMANALQNSVASSVHAVRVREGYEHILQGLLRRYAGEYVGDAPLAAGTTPPQFQGPAVVQFGRQVGQEVISASVHSSRLHPLHSQHSLEGTPIKLDLGPGQPNVTLTFGDQKKGTETQLVSDEIREVATLALASVCNPNHRSLFEFQAKARLVRRWLLTAEALLRHQRLQLGRLTEAEVQELEPRNEPEFANRLLITAVLTLLGELPVAEISLWKKCRQNLGAPLLQKVIDFDPTSSTVKQDNCRDAIRFYKQIMPHKNEMFAAAAALHDWLGAVFWVRKEMRAAAGIVRETTVQGLNSNIAKGNLERVRAILEVDLFHGHGVDDEGHTPLHAAATKGGGHEGLTDLLLSLDSAEDMHGTVDKVGKTPMHHAVEKQLPSMVRQLSNVSGTLDEVDSDQYTALMYAVVNKDVTSVHQLLESGADVNIITERGSSMDLAAGWPEGQEVLQTYGGMTKGALGVKSKKTEDPNGMGSVDDTEDYGDEV